jgi:hypothetical protein
MAGLMNQNQTTTANAQPPEIAQRAPDVNVIPELTSPFPTSNRWKVDAPLMAETPQISQTQHSATSTADAAKTGPADLVENRVGQITNADSPLMQLARTTGTQQANARGLINTSMGIGAAQDSVIKAATPIAMADSSATNQTNQFNASNEQQANLQNATQAQRTSELNAASDNSAIQTNTENSMRTNLANLDVASRAFMADIEQKNKQLIQTSANAATLFNTYQQQVSAIMTSPNLNEAGKEKAIKSLQIMLQDSLAAQDAVSGLNLSDIIFNGEAGTGPSNPSDPGTSTPPPPDNSQAPVFTDPNNPPNIPAGGSSVWSWNPISSRWEARDAFGV